MVANGLGMTLLPELSIKLECRHDDIRLMRFTDPQPRRVVGLAWRRSSPRKPHFVELGKLITSASVGTNARIAKRFWECFAKHIPDLFV